MLSKLKTIVQNLPYPISKPLSKVPFSLRFGNSYVNHSKLVNEYFRLSEKDQQKFLLNKLNDIFVYAKNKHAFYQDLYKNIPFNEITSLEQWKELPIITKNDIRKYFDTFNGHMKLNTGGSTGEPFSFFVDRHAFAREWAHMHYIWKQRDYRYTDLKITLRGKNLGNSFYKYNAVHNEFIINTYLSSKEHKDEIIKLFKLYPIKYIHGYPSAVYAFLKELEPILTKEEKNIISSVIRSCLLGSEFPSEYIVKYLKEHWNLDYLSWYGHSEMCVLAFDDKKINEYKVLQTYGFAEEVNDVLVGTSYWNYDMPFIRYSTGDKIKGITNQSGILESFSITDGREGDFVVDKNDKTITLTSLIFGRHHRIFEVAEFVQISQKTKGQVIVYVTCSNNKLISANIKTYFDFSHVNIDFTFEIINTPIKTKAGKVSLKVT